ncbi:ABC transporter permease [Saccharicrinis sp. FJH2]|uniref:ABC transporter permease n=1 Tax=Saccharicrinis sp. FJH65 TaxID=3344659 RepID=UPI0035F3C8D9
MKLYFLAVLRRFKQNKLTPGISILGLTIGFTVFLFIFSWIESEKSYDRFWEDAGNMYHVELIQKSNGDIIQNTARNYNGVGPVLMNALPEIAAATHLDKDIITVFTPEANVQNINMFFTDSMFFKVFPRHLTGENTDQLFNDIHYAAISRSLASRLFGNQDPVNKTFKLNEGWEFIVNSVFDDVPENSHIKFDLILQRKALLYYMRNFDYATGQLDNGNIASFADRDPYSRGQWNGRRGYTYIRLKNGSMIQSVEDKYAKAISPCISHFAENNEEVTFEFKPVKSIHLDSKKENEMFANGSHIKVIAFLLIAILLIVTSVLNYINLSVASSINMRSSQNIHSILGAKKLHFFYGSAIESFMIFVLAGIVSFTFSFLILRNGNNIFGFDILPTNWLILLKWCTLLTVSGTLLSSVYPLIFSGKRTATIIRGTKQSNNKKSPLSITTLVVFQFIVSIFLIIGTLTIYRQLLFMQQSETGMKMEQTLVSFSPMTMIKKPNERINLETFRNEVQKIQGVTDFTTAEIKAGEDYKRSSNNIYLSGQDQHKKQFAVAHIDYDYLDFFAVPLLEGKMYSTTFQVDGDEVILNETACKQLGLKPSEAINKILFAENRNNRIIGVVKDHHHLSLKDAIQPVVFFNSIRWSRTVGYYFIKISPQDMPETIAGITALWEQLYPEEKFHYAFLNDTFNAAYTADNNFGKVYLFLSLLTIAVAAMGLFALALFASKQRIKEIGIRKVNGAKVYEILAMLNKDFVKWVIVAFIVASPIAWYTMHSWLENFAYKTELSWWIFALAGILALGIAILTVSFQSWRAATKNPVEALRYE